MKKQIIMWSFALCASLGYSQANSPSWPASGPVGIGTSVPLTGLRLDVANVSAPSFGPNLIKLAYFGYRLGLVQQGQTATNTGVYFQDVVAASLTRYTKLQSVLADANAAYLDFNSPLTTNTTRAAFSFGYNGVEAMRINQTGKVRIGSNDRKTPDGYRLFVEEGILTEKVKVAVSTLGDWSDYVFASDYKLMPLDEVASFTKANKHLPNVPSAKEMVDGGLDVAKMDAKLLEKIEELTLYIIDQDNNTKNLKADLEKQKKQDEGQKKEIEELKAQMKLLMEKQ